MHPVHAVPTKRTPLLFERVSRWSPACIALYGIAMATAAATFVMPRGVAAAEDSRIERLATCKDSWFEWKEGTPRMTEYIRYLESTMAAQDDGQSMKPKSAAALLGMPVVAVYPQSVGMGVGFSTLVDAGLPEVRRAFEAKLGHPMTCTSGDGTIACESKVADRKTITLIANLPSGKPTLAGCYYFYQQ